MDKDYVFWNKYTTMFPKGWKLKAYTSRQSALFVKDEQTCELTALHAELIANAYYGALLGGITGWN